MKLCIENKNGIPYAKVPGKSVRKNGKISKEGVIYLGRVIDEEHHVFYSRARGIYTYDPETGIFGTASETYVSELKADGRKKPKVYLDFGDAYFVNSLIYQCGYDKVLESIPYRNKDTLFAMVLYYILCNSSNSHAHTWFEGNYVSAMYPRANLISQQITDFLTSLGQPKTIDAYFDAHVKWLMKICDDPATLIDSTGLPNNIHFPLTAVSNHNGKISREVRMTTAVQRDTGYPILFRVTPGNINDMSAFTRTLNALLLRDVTPDFIIMDAGYYTNENIEQLYDLEIDFLTRLSSKYKIYNDVVKQYGPLLQREENLVKYKDRYVYIKRIDQQIGLKNHEAYVYLGYDVDRGSDEAHKALKRARKKKTSLATVHKDLQDSGYFMIVSSLPFQEDGILPAYYARQMVEQYFDISKGSSRLTPLRIHSEETMYGHLLLSMVAATINVYIQNKTNKIYDDREEIFMALRNQKCVLYKNKITTAEPQAKANEFYNTFKILCPLYLDQTESELIPRYSLSKPKAQSV